MLKADLQTTLKSVLSEIGITNIEPQIERPADLNHGDYSTNIALVAAKKLNKAPREVAEEIVTKFKVQSSKFKVFDKVEVAGAGFINFFIAQEELSNNLNQLLGGDEKIADIGKNKKVIVEYSSPNIAKPFTIGHLRSTIIGDAVANLFEAVGYKVYRDSHVGDWGTQFGKQIYAIKKWGKESEIENSSRPVKVLVDLYIKFHEEAEKDPKLEDEARLWFKKLEDGDSEARRLWQKCIEWSWKEFEDIYKRLDVTFTENGGKGYSESFFEDKMEPVIDELKNKKLLSTGKEGARIVEFEELLKLPPLMILKKDGATLYATRDLATDKFRLEKYGMDIKIVNEVGAEQALYFEQLYALEELLGWYRKDQRVHVRHGLYRFTDQKMSTRRGNVIWLDTVLDEAIDRAGKLQKAEVSDIDKNELAKSVAIGALKWNDLKRDAKQDVVFNWDDILNMEGNSGPYLQYTYARTQSVMRKSEIRNPKFETSSNIQNYKFETEESILLRLLYCFDEIIIEAAEKYSPNIVANYLYNLAQAFNLFYQKHQILNSASDIKQFRLVLTEAVGKTIKRGLYLLGIDAPERM